MYFKSRTQLEIRYKRKSFFSFSYFLFFCIFYITITSLANCFFFSNFAQKLFKTTLYLLINFKDLDASNTEDIRKRFCVIFLIKKAYLIIRFCLIFEQDIIVNENKLLNILYLIKCSTYFTFSYNNYFVNYAKHLFFLSFSFSKILNVILQSCY